MFAGNIDCLHQLLRLVVGNSMSEPTASSKPVRGPRSKKTPATASAPKRRKTNSDNVGTTHIFTTTTMAQNVAASVNVTEMTDAAAVSSVEVVEENEVPVNEVPAPPTLEQSLCNLGMQWQTVMVPHITGRVQSAISAFDAAVAALYRLPAFLRLNFRGHIVTLLRKNLLAFPSSFLFALASSELLHSTVMQTYADKAVYIARDNSCMVDCLVDYVSGDHLPGIVSLYKQVAQRDTAGSFLPAVATSNIFSYFGISPLPHELLETVPTFQHPPHVITSGSNFFAVNVPPLAATIETETGKADLLTPLLRDLQHYQKTVTKAEQWMSQMATWQRRIADMITSARSSQRVLRFNCRGYPRTTLLHPSLEASFDASSLGCLRDVDEQGRNYLDADSHVLPYLLTTLQDGKIPYIPFLLRPAFLELLHSRCLDLPEETIAMLDGGDVLTPAWYDKVIHTIRSDVRNKASNGQVADIGHSLYRASKHGWKTFVELRSMLEDCHHTLTVITTTNKDVYILRSCLSWFSLISVRSACPPPPHVPFLPFVWLFYLLPFPQPASTLWPFHIHGFSILATMCTMAHFRN